MVSTPREEAIPLKRGRGRPRKVAETPEPVQQSRPTATRAAAKAARQKFPDQVKLVRSLRPPGGSQVKSKKKPQSVKDIYKAPSTRLCSGGDELEIVTLPLREPRVRWDVGLDIWSPELAEHWAAAEEYQEVNLP